MIHSNHFGVTMINFNKSSDLPAFDIFEKFFQFVFNCKWEDDAIVRGDSTVIKTEHMSLLFAWPGILSMQLVTLTGNTEYKQQLQSLKKTLDENLEYSQIRYFLDNLIKSKSIPPTLLKKALQVENSGNLKEQDNLIKQLLKYQPKIFETIRLLIHSKSILMRHRSNMVRLGSSLGNFYLLCCIIAKLIGWTEEDAIITLREIQDVLEKCNIPNKFDIYFLSEIWMMVQNRNFGNTLDSFISSNNKKKDSIKYLKDSIKVPSIQRVLHKIKTESSWSYAILKKFDQPTSNPYINVNSSDVAINVNLNKYFEYSLWHLRLKEEISDNDYTTAFLFLDSKGKGKDTLENLMIRLYQVAKQSSLAIQSIIESWEELIDNPAEIIESNLEQYDEWIFSLIDSYQSRDEFFNFKSLSRIIGDLDTDLDYEIIKEVRDEYKTAKYYHIPIELREKLLKTKEELDLFVGLVIKNPDVFEEEEILVYFDEHRSKYSYMDLLEHDDVKTIIFSTEANASRDNRRKILSIINKKLGGRDFKESTLTKLLGLEPGKEKYLKYSNY
jgi:hypothetical protein